MTRTSQPSSTPPAGSGTGANPASRVPVASPEAASRGPTVAEASIAAPTSVGFDTTPASTPEAAPGQPADFPPGSVTGSAPPGGGEETTPGAEVTRLLTDLRATISDLRCLGSDRLKQEGVSMTHLHAMALLERYGPLSMSSLGERLDVALSSVTGLVDRMAERGLVERIRVPDDRRVILVGLTDRGRRLLEEMDLLRSDLLSRVLARLEPSSLATIAAAIALLREAVREAIAEARSEPPTPSQTAPSRSSVARGGPPSSATAGSAPVAAPGPRARALSA